MKIASKLAAAAIVALLLVPSVALADNHKKDCDVEENDDDCKREKPRFQTKFFSG